VSWLLDTDVICQPAKKGGDARVIAWLEVSKAFANDVLLALTCREAGCVLVTDNERDFERIRRFVQFNFMKPWPGGQVS
jgi:predicted nucleic acid-binding protein